MRKAAEFYVIIKVNLVEAFAEALCVCNSIQVELIKALRWGLGMATGYRRCGLIVNVDLEVLVSLMKKELRVGYPHYNLIMDCKRLLF